MRLLNGRWQCLNCGAELDNVPADKRPSIVIEARSGEPNLRVLIVDDREVHRCVLQPFPPQQP